MLESAGARENQKRDNVSADRIGSQYAQVLKTG